MNSVYHDCIGETMKSFNIGGYHYYRETGKVIIHPVYIDLSSNPTQEEITAKQNEIYALKPLQELREKRNKLLAESDWTQMSDVVLADKEDWKMYRQALRDLPSQVEPKLNEDMDALFPTKPTET